MRMPLLKAFRSRFRISRCIDRFYLLLAFSERLRIHSWKVESPYSLSEQETCYKQSHAANRHRHGERCNQNCAAVYAWLCSLGYLRSRQRKKRVTSELEPTLFATYHLVLRKSAYSRWNTNVQSHHFLVVNVKRCPNPSKRVGKAVSLSIQFSLSYFFVIRDSLDKNDLAAKGIIIITCTLRFI
jgi:hypothetical protein